MRGGRHDLGRHAHQATHGRRQGHRTCLLGGLPMLDFIVTHLRHHGARGMVCGRQLAQVRLQVLLDLPLDEAEAAHQRSRAGKVVGKLLLVP